MAKAITGSAMLQAMKLWTPIITRCRKSLGNDVDDIDLGTSTEALVKLCMKTEHLEKLLAAYRKEARAAEDSVGVVTSGTAVQRYMEARAARIKLEEQET